LLNVEFYFGDYGDVFDGDGLILIIMDTCLLLKLYFRITLHLNASHKLRFAQREYDIVGVAWAMCTIYYHLSLAFVFILQHKLALTLALVRVKPEHWSLPFGGELVWTLIMLCTHPFVMDYTSLLRQGIKANSRALATAPQLKEKQQQFYEKWFSISRLWRFLNIVAYTVCALCYIILIATTSALNKQREEMSHIPIENGQDISDSVELGIIFLMLITWSLNTVLMVNLVFGILKRVGVKFNFPCQPLFSDTTYVEALKNF